MNMLVLLHVLIALSSIVYTTYLFVRPSKSRLYVSYGLVALTLSSGTYLVISTHARLLQSCVAGLVYLGIISGAIAAAHYKLSAIKVDSKNS